MALQWRFFTNSAVARELTYLGFSDFVRKYIQDICCTGPVTHCMNNRDDQEKATVDKISPEATNDLDIPDVDRFRQGQSCSVSRSMEENRALRKSSYVVSQERFLTSKLQHPVDGDRVATIGPWTKARRSRQGKGALPLKISKRQEASEQCARFARCCSLTRRKKDFSSTSASYVCPNGIAGCRKVDIELRMIHPSSNLRS